MYFHVFHSKLMNYQNCPFWHEYCQTACSLKWWLQRQKWWYDGDVWWSIAYLLMIYLWKMVDDCQYVCYFYHNPLHKSPIKQVIGSVYPPISPLPFLIANLRYSAKKNLSWLVYIFLHQQIQGWNRIPEYSSPTRWKDLAPSQGGQDEQKPLLIWQLANWKITRSRGKSCRNDACLEVSWNTATHNYHPFIFKDGFFMKYTTQLLGYPHDELETAKVPHISMILLYQMMKGFSYPSSWRSWHLTF